MRAFEGLVSSAVTISQGTTEAVKLSIFFLPTVMSKM